MSMISLPFLHRADFKRKTERAVTKDWVADTMPFEVEDFSDADATIVMGITVKDALGNEQAIAWRRLDDGRMMRPILSPNSMPLRNLEDLLPPNANALLVGGWRGEPWLDHPLARDIRF